MRLFSVYLISTFILCVVLIAPSSAVAAPAQLRIVSPEKDSIISSKMNLEFQTSDFNLTAKPETSSNSGVIQIYVDDSFYTNTATNSAILTIPKQGTHFIETELVSVARNSFVPRILDSMYVNVGKRTPHVRFTNLMKDQTLFSSMPTLNFDVVNLENLEYYYLIYVDNELDGNTKEKRGATSYTLARPLSEGKHDIKIVIYDNLDKPILPATQASTSIVYSSKVPKLLSVELPKTAIIGVEIDFKAVIEDFKLGQDGYLAAVVGGLETKYFDNESGKLSGLELGLNKVSFTLYDKKGRLLFSEAPVEKVIEIKNIKDVDSSKFGSSGVFTTPQDGGQPNWIFIGLAIVEAIAIITFATLLFKKEK
ncbi:MAG: hypothetical protein M3P33_04335 [bacterium]|nr:hypothetical protein [bacterium]